MATPPLSPHSGPAWTRKQQQAAGSDPPPASTPTPPTASSSPRKTPRTRPARSPYGVGGPAFANSAPLIAASLGGAGSGSVSTLSLPAQTTTQDAPYLTHIHRHHGQLTLVAPDNLGVRRQPGTVDPPERRVDAGGGWGVSPPPLVEDESAEPNVMKKKKRKKKSALEQRREKEEREKRERDILSAVQNAGRTPSPSRTSAFDAGAVRSAEMGRTTSGTSLEVPRQQEPGRRRRSRSRVREGESRSVESSTPARHPRGPRPPPAPAVVRAQSADNVQQMTTSAARPSPRPSAEQRNPTRRPRPSPASAAPSTSAPAPSASTPQPTPQPIPVLPPLTFSSIDDSSLDDHLSLGLLDPSMLLMSPPPAYTGRGEAGDLPPLPSLGSAALGGREARRRGERYSMAPPGSPPPSALALSLPPPPPTSLPPPTLPPPTASPSASSSESETSDAENDNDTDSFILHSSDPLVLAWEADRSAGIYSLDERIERDLERRRRAARGSPVDANDGAEGANANAAAVGGSSSSSATAQPAADADAGADVEGEADTEDDPTALALLRRRIALAERENNSRGVVRALSVHATRSMRRAGRAARERRGRGASLGGAAGLGEVREEDGAGTAEEARPAEEAKPPSPAQETPSPAPSPSPAPAVATPSSPSPAPVEVEAEPESESDAETAAPATSARPSRTLTLQGHRMLAEAAERRMAAERAARARAAEASTLTPAVAAEPVRTREGKSEAEAPQRSEVYERLFPVRPGLFGASSGNVVPRTPASTSTATAGPSESSTAAPSPPAKARPPPPPPPRSRPSSARNSLERPVEPSSSPPASAPPTGPARTPSFRRPPPPPPPGASAILAARRASLRPVQPNPLVLPASTAEPVRRRPLPVPPAPLAEDRLDAFTALRMARGEFPSPPRLSSSGDDHATPRPAPSPAPVEPTPADEVEHPGPPLPRRPPRAAPAAVSVSAAQDQPATLAEVPEFSMYTDLDLLLARLEAQENGSPAGGTIEGATTEPAQGGENYDDFLLLSDVLGQAVPAGASPAELESLTVARVECERRRVTKSGKVKSKLSVVGVRCVDCAICLARFKVDQFAVVLPECLHIFHENCIRSWFRLSRVCPVCRAEVFPPRPPPAVDLLQ